MTTANTTSPPIIIDGSEGEGGGQVLRTALALSAVTGRPFVLQRIRAKRSKPGLMRQHLTCVEAAAALCCARTEGAALLSTELRFVPSSIRGGSFSFAIGSAGSTSLVAQTVIPIAMFAPSSVDIVMDGGTHVPFAPVTDYLQRCFLPALHAMGAAITMARQRVGFYPAGGGRVLLQVNQSSSLMPWTCMTRGELRSIHATALFAPGASSSANQMLQAAGPAMASVGVPVTVSHQPVSSQGPGVALIIEAETDRLLMMATSIPERGVAPLLALQRAANAMLQWFAAEVAVDEHLADQMLLPLALGRGGKFTTTAPTQHSLTNATIIKRFLPQVGIDFEQLSAQQWCCTVMVG